MARVLQIIDVDSDGHKVRLDDGRVVLAPHGGDLPHIGQEFAEPQESKQPEPDVITEPEPQEVKSPTIEQLNGEAQAQAETISEAVDHQPED